MKRFIRGALAGLGLKLSYLPSGKAGYDYVYPVANYAPWNLDTEFLSVYTTIRAHTLVDLYRCWELWSLAGETEKLGGGILEVGVWRGGTGALMARKARLAGASSPVFLCDTFEGVVKAGQHDAHYKGGEHSDTSTKVVEHLLRTLHVENVSILKGVFPDETGHMVDASLRFRLCHIDVDVYDSARDVMDWIWERMVPGGVVVFDDYGFNACEGITRFVNEQVNKTDRMVIHNLNGHGIVVKLGTNV